MRLLRRNTLIILVAAFSLNRQANTSYSEEPQKKTVKPMAGYEPDEETAIKIAIAVWSPIYGKDKVEAERPYKPILKDGVWYEDGSRPKGWGKSGVAEVEINKDDGRIIRISRRK